MKFEYGAKIVDCKHLGQHSFGGICPCSCPGDENCNYDFKSEEESTILNEELVGKYCKIALQLYWDNIGKG
jgi:hypothetical protein